MRKNDGIKTNTYWGATWFLITILQINLSCGTFVGNPEEEEDNENEMILTSDSFEYSQETALTESSRSFELCIDKLWVITEDNPQGIQSDFEKDLVVMEPGSGGEWGSFRFEQSQKIVGLKISLSPLPEICGVSYALKIKEMEVVESTELVWEIESSEVDDLGGLNIVIQHIVDTAEQNGFDKTNFKESIRGQKGRAMKKNKEEIAKSRAEKPKVGKKAKAKEQSTAKAEGKDKNQTGGNNKASDEAKGNNVASEEAKGNNAEKPDSTSNSKDTSGKSSNSKAKEK